MRTALASLALAALLLPVTAFGEATKEDFVVRTTQDLVDLCSVEPDAPLYGRAIEFCHGYVIGAWSYHQAQASGPDGIRLVCLPDPEPTRRDAVAGFLAWIPANSQYLTEPAVETFFRYLTATWPCPETAGTKGASK